MMSTTVGETAADFLNMDLGFGLINTSFVVGGLLAVTLYFQMRATRYIPVLYWLVVVFISVFGTLVTDNLTDAWHVPLAWSSAFFTLALITTFAVWYRREKRSLFIMSIAQNVKVFTGWRSSLPLRWAPRWVTGWRKD
jgi:uncharacterized membrane-anchored protein